MIIVVRSVGLDLSPSLHAYAEKRVQFALDRAVRAPAAVLVRFRDENGPRGGLDKHCTLVVRDEGTVTIAEATGGDLFSAVDLACGRISEAVRRRRDRGRAERRRSRGGLVGERKDVAGGADDDRTDR